MTSPEQAVFLMLVILAGFVGPGVFALYLALRRSAASHPGYVEMREMVGDLWEQQGADHNEMRRMRETIAALEQYAFMLGRMFEEATGKKPPPIPVWTAARPVGTDEPIRLQRRIAEQFSASEIASLAFDLGLDDELEGDSATERAQSLVRIAKKRRLTAKLIDLCRQDRPNGGF
jgi:hypothetical protein